MKDNIDAHKIVASNKMSFGKNGFEYFIGYKDAKKIRPLCIFLPKMNAYRRGFDRTKCMPFLVIEEKLFEKYNEIWKRSQQHCQKRIWQ